MVVLNNLKKEAKKVLREIVSPSPAKTKSSKEQA
jgi:hypothetical protein